MEQLNKILVLILLLTLILGVGTQIHIMEAVTLLVAVILLMLHKIKCLILKKIMKINLIIINSEHPLSFKLYANIMTPFINDFIFQSKMKIQTINFHKIPNSNPFSYFCKVVSNAIFNIIMNS
jgi:hypothetical protein